MFSGGLRLRRSAQTRRSAVFVWTALFVLSLGMQYAAFLAPAGVRAAQPAVSLEQCRNGAADSPNDCVELGGGTGWVNGNAGASQAHYVEGQSIPYRLVMTDLPTGTEITLVLEYDVKHSDRHAIDYLTSYDRIPEAVTPTSGVDGIAGTTGTFPIPRPVGTNTPVAGMPEDSWAALPAGEREMTLFGGTISSIGYAGTANLSLANSSQQIVVNFTVDSATAVLAWGGHIASRLDWGFDGTTPRSAGGISGSPYHMRTIDWNLNNLGNQDRSLSAGAVAPPAPAVLQITKVVGGATSAWGGGTFNFTYACGTTSGSTTVTLGNGVTTGTASVDVPGNVTCVVEEVAPFPSPGTGYAWGTPTYDPANATVQVPAGGTAIVTVTNPRTRLDGSLRITKEVTRDTTGFAGGTFDFSVACGADGTFTGSITLAAGVLSGSTTIGPIPANASCTVTETAKPAAGTDHQWLAETISPSPVVIVANQTVTVTVTNPRDFIEKPGLAIDKVANTASFDQVGDILSYTITATNTGNMPLTGVTVSDPKLGTLSCTPAQPATLAIGASIECTGTYAATQGDLDAGKVDNTATADSNETDAVQDSATVPAVQRPALSITKVATEKTYDAVGDIIHYTITATNTGNVTLTNVVVTDPKVTGLSCTPALPVGSLAPGATITCTATHTIVQADLDAGSFLNTACVDDGAGGAAQACDDETTTGEKKPKLTLVKSADPQTYDEVGDVIGYSYLLTNSGNVTLFAPYAVTDDKATATCPQTPGTLAPGASVTCTASYTIGQADLNSGSVTNVAEGSAYFDGKPVPSNEDDETVVAVQDRDLVLVKSADPQTYDEVGDVISYDYLVTNNGNVSLAGPVTVADDKVSVTCPAVSTVGNLDGNLDPGESITCTASHTITQADLDAGSITNVAKASAGGVDSNEDQQTVTAVQDPALAIEKTANAESYDAPGDVLTYTIVATNTGNVTLTGVTISDPKLGTLLCTPTQPATLAPGATLECSGAYTTTQGDVDAGKVDNTATADSNETGEVSDDATVPAIQDPDLAVVKGVSLTNGSGYQPSVSTTINQTVYYRITVTNTGNVTLTGLDLVDSLVDLAGKGCSIPATLAPAASFSCDYSMTAVVGETENTATADSDQTPQEEDTATVTVEAPVLGISKSVAGNTAGTEPLIPDDDGGPAPKAKIGDTLTFTLEYTLANGPISDAEIVDVLPAGYGEPFDISDGGVASFVAGAWQITWSWERLAESGSVSYKVVVLEGANELAQPRVNNVTIDSADTDPASDTQPVVVAGEERGETFTPPPTSTISTNPAGDGSGGMLLVLLAIAGLVTVLGVLTPAPARARRRSRRG